MKLELICTPNQVSERPKKPIDHFKKCPACGGELIPLDPDVLCSKCSWDSAAWHVSNGGMDDIFRAAREFSAGERRSKMKLAKSAETVETEHAAAPKRSVRP